MFLLLGTTIIGFNGFKGAKSVYPSHLFSALHHSISTIVWLLLLLLLLALSYSAPRRSFLFLLRLILQIEFSFAGFLHTFFVVFGFNTAFFSMASSLSLLSYRVLPDPNTREHFASPFYFF